LPEPEADYQEQDGTERLGQPSTAGALGSSDDLDALERLGDELLGATSCEQLLRARPR